jgi:hypothetical protein
LIGCSRYVTTNERCDWLDSLTAFHNAQEISTYKSIFDQLSRVKFGKGRNFQRGGKLSFSGPKWLARVWLFLSVPGLREEGIYDYIMISKGYLKP